jgi:hypothetical protein
MNEKFQADVIIQSEWIDNSDDLLLNNYDPNKQWNPKLIIENIITINEETITYNVTKRNGFNIITELRIIKGIKILYYPAKNIAKNIFD